MPAPPRAGSKTRPGSAAVHRERKLAPGTARAKAACAVRRHWRREEWLYLNPALPAAALVLVTALAPAVALLAAAQTASATTVPPPPSGWTTAFSDSFSGASGSGVDSSWTYDQGTQYNGTGCAANWGTGEVERETNSTANVSEDGSGHLNITPVNSGGSWTSGRVQHLFGHRQPDQRQRRVDYLVSQRQRLPHRHREPDRHVSLAGRDGSRVLPHPGRRNRRRLPERRLQLHHADELDQFRRGHERRLRGRVHHHRRRWRRGQHLGP